MNTEQAVMAWLSTARKKAPGLDMDADALLFHLLGLSAQKQALEASRQQRGTLALFGHSRASKDWLLNALCGESDARLPIAIGEKRLDYFNHINPGHQPCQLALRFTRDTPSPHDEFPLRLRVLREAQLAQVFITHAENCAFRAETFRERLTLLQNLRQPQTTPTVTAEEVATVVRYWQSRVPARVQEVSDHEWYTFVELLPSLDLNARTHAWSLLWGDHQDLTQQWQMLSHALRILGNATDIYAPLSLLVDAFLLPTAEFLAAGCEDDSSVLVQLPGQQTVNISRSTLAILTNELVLCSPCKVLDDVDILDIPASPFDESGTLWASKCHWLLEAYRQQRQPDVLVVCNATPQRSAIPRIANALIQWVEATQPQQDGGLPGLVWAITPQDDRAAHTVQHDEAVQHLVGKPGQRWGALHAFDSNSLARLIEWLSRATLRSTRNRRFDTLMSQHQQAIQMLLSPIFNGKKYHSVQCESMIRALQGQAAHHGELLAGLLPSLERFNAITQVQHSREARVTTQIHAEVDLFAEPKSLALPQKQTHDAGTLAFRLWCQHVRHWGRQQASATQLEISPATLQQLCDTLIAISSQLNLAEQLRHAATQHQANPAQLRAMIGNFISWLGYAGNNTAERPASRAAVGLAIFANPPARTSHRLTQLTEQPVHAASRYVYDWLVALYTRAGECQDDIFELSTPDRLALQHILKVV
ncbi:virulence factor SrfC family protein [Pseudocitrobacter vendiensis]|uniref:Virulence effector SrfC n=1 Tax=Pseudocitrobacter vendiensis TaxID=2488306 RepID=A0ABM9FCS7_9ENTR|nr:virulence factor SrfC family protein [Pseudocitrobacter vendiensis]CAH6660721.1 Virulence effector SrfC [Pseudocitrobacter vendiensis]